MKETVAVAMSGGADSTYAAYLLKEQGYNVIGLMAKFWVVPNEEGTCRSNLCCSPESVEVARANAKKLDIEFFIVDLSAEFKEKVVDYYIKEYKSGRTPNPCVVCNQEIKFGLLLEKAKQLGADYFATGHYVKKGQNLKSNENSQFENFLSRASDKTKDQSYFLWRLSQEQLSKVIFPLGNLIKKDILKKLNKLGLELCPKESQDICFIGDLTQRQFLQNYLQSEPGPIKDMNGNVVGEHKGIFGYTIGQRHNLGLNLPEPKYVIKLDGKSNTIYIGDLKDLESREFEIEDCNFFENPNDFEGLEVMIRYNQIPVKCSISGNKVVLSEPLRAVTPGQSAVFYCEDRLIGGGIIK